MFDTLVCKIDELSHLQPDKIAVVFKKESLTYAELSDRMKQIGSQLTKMGIKKGDRVAFTALSRPEMAAAYLGIHYCGGVAVFLDKNSTPDSIAAICRDADAEILLTDQPMRDVDAGCKVFSLKEVYHKNAEEIVSYEKPEKEDLAELLFTTGTTGQPKGVMLTYRAVYHIFANTIKGIGIREDDVVLLPLPLNHSFALRVLRAVLYRGGTVVLQNGFTFAKEVEINQETFHCTAMVAVPASMEILRGQMQDRFAEILGKFRYIEISAGSLTIEQKKRLTECLPKTELYNTWGSSESGGALFLNVKEAGKYPGRIASIGRPLTGIQVKVLDDNANEISSDQEHPGRLALQGKMQMSGYWRRDELTAETLRAGWLLTSDMVYTDSDGYVYMLGRADDMINVGGEKVSPIEVEQVAGLYNSVRECACIGVDDPKGILGQIPILFVVPKDNNYAENELRTFLSQKIERYKIPVYYIMV